ncbi:MAG: hypothetical protein HZB38_03125 [Planctomycetes bacterium]|nr:hypothetical protein [Planctomycetota bacterium]
MDGWKKQFLDKLGKAQATCAQRFEEALDDAFNPAFADVSNFLRDNGFKVSQPLSETGRRSYKFELAENAYALVLVRLSGVDEIELRGELIVPGNKPVLKKQVGSVKDVNAGWAEKHFRNTLDQFVELLSGQKPGAAAPEGIEELATV